MHQRRFSRAGNAGDGHQHPQRNLDIKAVQVVGLRTAQHQLLAARLAPPRGHGNRNLPGEIAPGQRIGIGFNLGEYALGQQLAAELTRAGTQVEQMIGGAQNIGIVLDHQDGVAQVAQFFEDADQPRGVARVQADGGLVEHIERAHQPRAQRSGQLDALRLAAGERGSQPVERQVFEAHCIEKLQPLPHLVENRRRRSPPASATSSSASKNSLALRDGQRRRLADVQPVEAHRARFGAQALAAAIGALGVAAILAEHHAHVQLVLLALHLREETMHALEALPCRAARISRAASGSSRQGTSIGMPSVAACLLQLGEPGAILGPVPGIDGSVIQRQSLVGNDQVHVEVDGVAESLAARACAERVVEAEQPRLRFAPGPMAVRALVGRGKAKTRTLRRLFTRNHFEDHFAAFAIGDFSRVHNARAILRAHHDAIDQHKHRQSEVEIEQRFGSGEFENPVALIQPVEARRCADR